MDTTEQVFHQVTPGTKKTPQQNSQQYVNHSVRWLTLADYVISCLVVTPFVISYWRASWKLLDKLMGAPGTLLTAGLCAGLGWCVCLVCYLLQTIFRKCQDKRPPLSLPCVIGYRVYIYIIGIAVIAHWRGVWMMWELLTGRDVTSAVTSLLVGYVSLVLLRCLMNAVASPLSISTDVSASLFDCSTRFRTRPKKSLPTNSLENFTLDIIFTSAVVYSLCASLWRGIWLLEDLIVFPDQIKLTALLSLALGFGLVTLALLFQYSAQSTSEAMGKQFPFPLQVALQDILISIGLVGAVNVWRGLWILHDIWQSGSPPAWVLTVNHTLCILGLMLLQAGSSVHFRGCMRDGESAIFPVFYLRYILRHRDYMIGDATCTDRPKPTGKAYPSCSCNHYCLLLNVIRERNAVSMTTSQVILV